ncbi:CD209 antigen-like protein E [Mercenaria mercenaria]|uniref:CD209 antigen-like protein E n=1 Tax=Mercenaria mercenaria TaxID=6596 RepID=UPI00234EF9DB|nr:CD209 antigen-like protein E [Mercenaria mercenaria]
MNWNEAQDHCAVLGGQLATIKSLHEQMFVYELLNQADIGDIRVWIGASDIMAENTFVWIDGTTFSETFTYWSPGQPNNYNNQDCVDLFKVNGKWEWNDETCTYEIFSLCEFI